VEPVREPEQPRDEVLAAAAEHKRAVLAWPERRTGGNRHSRLGADIPCRLPTAWLDLGRRATGRQKRNRSPEHYMPTMHGQSVTQVFANFIH
jgi:hypothetical protein